MPMIQPQGRLAKRMSFYARNRLERKTRVILAGESGVLKTYHIAKGGFAHVMAIPNSRGTSMLLNV